MHNLASIPQEVLEQIAYFVATQDDIGPPSALLPLLSVNRKISSLLSASANPHLYARIFHHLFDTEAAARRMKPKDLSTVAMCEELQRRCILLKRIRDKLDSKYAPGSEGEEKEELSKVLWMSYLMMLENDGKNERQLREYAGIDAWLKQFWFDKTGSSRVMYAIRKDEWPANHENVSLGMWLFWLLLRPDDYMEDDLKFREATGILKIVALGAHNYPLSFPSWVEYIPRQLKPPTVIRHFNANLNLVIPAPSTPAILSYLTLANKLSVSWESINYMKPLAPTLASGKERRDSHEWDTEWARTTNFGDPKIALGNTLTGAFEPGTLEGVWEGLFTYTEFTAYAALLSGAPPATLQRSLVAQHRQTWKLREYHLYYDEDEGKDEEDVDVDLVMRPLKPGNPARAYIPAGTEIREGPTSVEIVEAGRKEPLVYHSIASRVKHQSGARVKDVFITGEGHSAWGQFNLLGRIRPSDGLLSLSKEYVDGDRGKWLYRGYLIGNGSGNLAGRWRDTLTLPHVAGYEGCFVMSRRG
ncbi:hypothetical protein BXZ70DRAFT_901552 [Cristinia sonorae]|uniref:F-box domain-containing protein n=1 Tax=Cristinia sonorae TaxID=1940300 RepID=A0A8K0UGG6_9AGAR|nr:hypothetical protein BXZ70DRAFT_901552 [Cristinia sonorae]